MSTPPAASTTLCTVCEKPTNQRCSRCHRVSFCSPEHQKLIWPFHKTQCDPSLETFRLPPLAPVEVHALAKYMRTVQVLCRPHKNRFSYLNLLKLADVETSNEAYLALQADMQQPTLPEPGRSHLLLATRHFLRAAPQDKSFSAPAIIWNEMVTHVASGKFPTWAWQVLSCTLFPLVFRMPSGENALHTDDEPLKLARRLCEQVLVHFAVAEEQCKHFIPHPVNDAVLEVCRRRVDAEFAKLPTSDELRYIWHHPGLDWEDDNEEAVEA
ncbi:hypothetical protein JCM10213v2_002945 [Rhodosporidiobolus nylandii]